MDAFRRLSQLSSKVKEGASPVWGSARRQFKRGLQWLEPGRRKLWEVGAGIVLGLLVLAVIGGASWVWGKYHANREDLTPIVTLLGAAVAAWVALGSGLNQPTK
jgi:hypothetical protein